MKTFFVIFFQKVVSSFDHPELVKLGHAELMEEIMIGESKLTRFTGCKGGLLPALSLIEPSQKSFQRCCLLYCSSWIVAALLGRGGGDEKKKTNVVDFC